MVTLSTQREALWPITNTRSIFRSPITKRSIKSFIQELLLHIAEYIVAKVVGKMKYQHMAIPCRHKITTNILLAKALFDGS